MSQINIPFSQMTVVLLIRFSTILWENFMDVFEPYGFVRPVKDSCFRTSFNGHLVDKDGLMFISIH